MYYTIHDNQLVKQEHYLLNIIILIEHLRY